jgi:cytochrome P450
MTAPKPRRAVPIGPVQSLRFLLNPLRAAPDLHRKWGGLVRLAKPAGGMTLVFEPEDVRSILTQPDVFEHLDRDTVPIRLPHGSATFRLTSGLLAFQNGDKHRALRRELMPAFDSRHLQNYFTLSRDSVREYIEGMDGRQGLDLNQICHELAMNTALLTLFGLKPGTETRTLSAAIRGWMQAGFSPWTLFLPFNLPGFSYRAFLRNGEKLEAHLLDMFRNGPQSDDPLIKVVFGEAWKKGELPPELVSRASGYMQASYETTANTLIWTLVILNLFPAVASRAAREMEEAVGDGDIQYHHLMAMPYMRAVVMEAVRMLPPLTLFPRIVTRPVSVGGMELSPGDRVAYGPILTHRLPHVFPRPLEFDPMRFLTPGLKQEGFLGFGGGPRRCPGEQFGVNEVLLILATWLRRFFPQIRDGSTIDARGVVIFTPTGPVPFSNVGRREWKARRTTLKGTAVWGIKAPF